ncbi:MAG: response regulator transcription factor [Hydrococcus sp. RM1_1_31]|nr:response regulator transcription factor [Hydrococcus sp. RM1_1_31]
MIRVLIVDDQTTIQYALRSYLELASDLTVVGMASNGQIALEMVKEHLPDVVLMDIEMPILDGLTATRIICDSFINTKVLIVSSHQQKNYLQQAVEVGARGYLLKTTPAIEIIHAIRSVGNGYFQLGPGLIENYLPHLFKSPSQEVQFQKLTTAIESQSSQSKTLQQIKEPATARERHIPNKIFSEGEFFIQQRNLKAEFHHLKLQMFRLEKNLSRWQNFFILFSWTWLALIGVSLLWRTIFK